LLTIVLHKHTSVIGYFFTFYLFFSILLFFAQALVNIDEQPGPVDEASDEERMDSGEMDPPTEVFGDDPDSSIKDDYPNEKLIDVETQRPEMSDLPYKLHAERKKRLQRAELTF